MKLITIREPQWKKRTVGIAKYKITEPILVEIAYLGKDGQKVYPGRYYMTKEKALTYPIQSAKGNVPELVIIPIADFKQV